MKKTSTSLILGSAIYLLAAGAAAADGGRGDPSRLVTRENIDTLIAHAGKTRDVKITEKSANGGGTVRRMWTGSYRFSHAKDALHSFVADLGRAARKTITESGGAVAPIGSYHGSADGSWCSDFTLNYVRAALKGFFYVSSTVISETEGSITVVWYEHESEQAGAGAGADRLEVGQADAGDEFEKLRRAGSQLTGYYSLKAPFKPAELRSLAEKARRDHGEQTRLGMLILHAAIKKDESFKDLIQNRELRKEKGADLSLAAYDYTMNRSEAALDKILAHLAAEDIGADSGAIVVLSTLNEWDRSIRAFRKHFVHTDGAGGECKLSFLATRAYLYPKEYAEMRTAIEAPMTWNEPLLSRKQ